MTEHAAEHVAIIDGPFENTRTVETWWWERPNGGGDTGYNRPDVLHRCARIFGGRVKVIRQVTHTTTTVHLSTRPERSGDAQR